MVGWQDLSGARDPVRKEMKLNQPCLDCGVLTTNGSRCPTHAQRTNAKWAAQRAATKQQTGQYSGAYQRLAKIIRTTAQVCHLCGQPFMYGDKIEADHLYPGTPITDISQLAPAHRACNQARGNKPLR
jgi:hypothetical protein